MRVSMSDGRGGEHHATVALAKLRGRDYRDKLGEVIDSVQAAIDGGEAPGEVRIG